MAKVIVWEHADGSLSVTTPGDALPQRQGETEAQWLDRVAAASLPGLVAADPRFAAATRRADVDKAALPGSRRWRNSWRWSGGGVAVNSAAARRQRRDEIVAENDVRLARVRARLQAAQEDDNPVQSALLKTKARAVRALTAAALDLRLAHVAVDSLADWTPDEWAGT